MSQHPQRERSFGDEMRNRVNVVLNLACIISALVPLLVSRPGTCGKKFFAGQALMSLIAMFFAVTLIDGAQAQAPFGLYAVLIACFLLGLHKARRKWLERQGWTCHSRYGGRPWFSWMSEGKAKTCFDPFVVAGLGFLCGPVSQGLFLWLNAAGFCHALVYSYAIYERNARLDALRDARLEQEDLMQRFREREGDH